MGLHIPHLDQYGNVNYHNMIRRVIEQRGKKTSSDHGWLSKTGKSHSLNSLCPDAMEFSDMTIVAVSVLFVILLAAINLILFAVRRFVVRCSLRIRIKTIFLRHRHRLQGRHLLSASITSAADERRLGGNRNLHRGPSGGDSGHALMNGNNGNNNNDILPAVG